MGYRNYIASLPKSEYETIKDFTREELYKYKGIDEDNDFGYLGVYEMGSTELYELGKYVDAFPDELLQSFFTNKDLQSYYLEDGELYLVGKEFLGAVINRYSTKIQEYYTKMLKPVMTDENYLKDPVECDSTDLHRILTHVRNMASEWGVGWNSDMLPYDLENGDSVTTSWKFEYELFELVRIYKSFDWDTNVLVYYGY